MINHHLLISVILPVYNSEASIVTAIKSILKQTLKNFELIIIDDCSTDNTLKQIKLLKDPRIVLIKNKKHFGVAKSLNDGLIKARGKFIARMDADDFSYPSRLKLQQEYLLAHPNVGIVGSWVELIDHQNHVLGTRKYPILPQDIKRKIFFMNPLCHSTVMFKTALVKRYGLYDESLDGAEDYDLWLRLNRYTLIANLPQILLRYRIHKNSISFQRLDKTENSLLKTILKSLKTYQYPKWFWLIYIMTYIKNLVPIKFRKIWYARFFTK